MSKPHRVKRVGGSLVIAITPDFIRANKLKPGDYVVLDQNKFKILRAEDFSLLGREPEPEAA